MFTNELEFYEGVTLDNFVVMVIREYIAYRRYKITSRLIVTTFKTTPSALKEYATISHGYENHFIINFPKVKFHKENGKLKVATQVELYSNKTKKFYFQRNILAFQREA